VKDESENYFYFCSKQKQMNTVYLSLGSNAGDRHDLLQRAIGMLQQKGVQLKGKSPVYETSPWGFSASIPFLNIVVEVITPLSLEEVFQLTCSVESTLGRERHQISADDQAYASRTIDIDILFYNSELYLSERLTIPHPRIPDRKFILEPMSVLAPDFMHPILGLPVKVLNQRCTDTGSVTLWYPEAMAELASDQTGIQDI
jgi:2-amino-4-hydroxy-6-hydroxymethyldihydropteridine diphosphokinase